MAPGVGFGERGERAGTGEFEEGEVERESWWRDCSSSPSESLNLFVEILLLGVAWPFGDDMVNEGSCRQSSPHTSPGCAGQSWWAALGRLLSLYATGRQDGGTSGLKVRNELDLCYSFGDLILVS